MPDSTSPMPDKRPLFAIIEELHTLGRWTGAPLLEILGAGILHGQNTAEVDQILAHIRDVWGEEEAAVRITQVRHIQQLLDQLHQLFRQLHQVGFELGIEQYMLLLHSLQKGFGLDSRDALRRVCRLIWVNDQAQEELFGYFFDRTVTLEPAWDYKKEARDLPESLAPEKEDKPLDNDALPNPEKPEETAAETNETPNMPDMTNDAALPDWDDSDLMDREAISHHIAPDEAAVLTFEFNHSDSDYSRYLLRNDYLPVTRRRLKQNWRFLRRMDRSGPKDEIDVQTTVSRLIRDGFLLEPVRRASRVNRAELLLLIDRQSGMVPFHSLGQRVQKTAMASGRLGHIETYFFNEVPPLHRDAFSLPAAAKYRPHLLFTDETTLEGVPVSNITQNFNPTFTSVLIFSDAGAARGLWDEDRIEGTARFLYQLTQLGLNQIAWLNPMPKERWSLREEDRWPSYAPNSATDIARMVPMFGMDQVGLFEAINTLRGRTGRPVFFT